MPIAGYHIIGIIGSTTYYNRIMLYGKMSKILAQHNQDVAFISGGAAGADTMGKDWARQQGPRRSFFLDALPIRESNDNYFLRNSVIAELADELVAFIPKNKFRSGTWNTINHFRQLGKTNYVVFDEDGNQWDRKWRQ